MDVDANMLITPCSLKAYFAAPVLPALIFGAWASQAGLHMILMAPIVYVFILLVSLPVGAAVLTLLEKFRLANLWTLTLAGALGGVAVSVLLRPDTQLLHDIAAPAMGGGLTAFIFAALRRLCLMRHAARN